MAANCANCLTAINILYVAVKVRHKLGSSGSSRYDRRQPRSGRSEMAQAKPKKACALAMYGTWCECTKIGNGKLKKEREHNGRTQNQSGGGKGPERKNAKRSHKVR